MPELKISLCFSDSLKPGRPEFRWAPASALDRKSTRLNSSHSQISYAVFCLKKKKINTHFLTNDPEDPVGVAALASALVLAAADLRPPRSFLVTPSDLGDSLRDCVGTHRPAV